MDSLPTGFVEENGVVHREPRWSLEEGARIAYLCREPAWHDGYLVGLYGSVLSGQGHDLDLLALPWRRSARVDKLVWTVESLTLAREVSREEGVGGKWGILLEDQAGRYIDISVRSPNETSLPY